MTFQLETTIKTLHIVNIRESGAFTIDVRKDLGNGNVTVTLIGRHENKGITELSIPELDLLIDQLQNARQTAQEYTPIPLIPTGQGI